MGEQLATGDRAEQWPAVLVPADRPRTAGRAARCTALTQLPREAFPAGTDEFLLACFAALLFRYTGQRKISVSHGSQCTRYLVSGRKTVAELLPQSSGPAPGTGESCELRLELTPRTVELHYEPALFDTATADRLLAHLHLLSIDAASAPHRPIELLRLMSDAELHTMLVAWNDTFLARDERACLHTGFESAAAAAPDAIAVVHQGRRWTYAEINIGANRLAHHLRERGVGPDTRVGIRLTRSPNLLISMLGVLKAGGAFVPIDPHHPAARIDSMLTGSRCAFLISDSTLCPEPTAGAEPDLLLDRVATLLAGQPATNPPASAGPDDLCYIIHTSGSTGVPKAIALRHSGVTNNINDLITRYGIGPSDSVLALSSPSFDMSIFELLGLTAAGGTVVIPDPEGIQDPAHWAQLIAEHQVTIWNSAPPLLGLLVDHLEQARQPEALPSLRLALLGGDWVPLTLPDRARSASPQLRVIVMGGATEASIHSTLFEVEKVDPAWTSIPYGRPMANQRTYILDETDQPVPPGVPGQLHLAGTGLARGYLNQPRLTAERFLEWSFGEVRGERLYRTGDLACYDRSGLIRLLGRIDLQVKINGQRIELGEIESLLLSHPDVRQVALAARNNQLVAYVVPSTSIIAPEQLVDFAAGQLPSYMVPAHIVVLEQLPLSPNGKVDRAALPDPQVARAPYRPAGTATERALIEILAELLGIARIGIDDDFRSLGGDSVQAIQLVSRARARGIVISTADVLGLRTISAIAAAACAPEAAQACGPGPTSLHLVDQADQHELTRRYPNLAEIWPVAPMQAGMLFESMLDDRSDGSYRLQTLIELTGGVDPERLRVACDQLVARHASLRTAFVCDVADDPVQVVLNDLQAPWRHVEVSDRGAGALDRLMAEERDQLSDLETPPLLRFALLSQGAGRAVLVVTAHHLLYDGWSEQVLANELAELYAGTELKSAASFGSYLRWLAAQDRSGSIRAWQDRLAGLSGPTLLAPQLDPSQPKVMRQRIIPLDRHELATQPRLMASRAALAQAAWAIVLSELTGQTDVVFGVTVSGRPGDLAGVERMVGLLINTIPLRISIDPEQPVTTLFADLASVQVSMLGHEYLGLPDIHHALGTSRLFDTLLVCQSFPPAGPGNEQLGLARIDSVGMGNYPLALLLEADQLVVQYDARCHDTRRVDAIVERFRQVAAELTTAAAAGRAVGSVWRGSTAGRVDAEARPAHQPAEPTSYAVPRAEAGADLQASLCRLFADALGVDRVAPDDNIFLLGCDSLKATRIIGGMRRSLGVETSIRTLFEYPSVAQLVPKLRPGSARPSLQRSATTS